MDHYAGHSIIKYVTASNFSQIIFSSKTFTFSNKATTILCESLTLFKYRWMLLEKLTIIDRDLKQHFKVYFPYGITFRFRIRLLSSASACLITQRYSKCFRFLCMLIALLLSKTVFTIIFVYSHIIQIMPSPSHVLTVCTTLNIAATSLFACVTAFNISCIFIINRAHCVNLMLEQLLFDEPLNDKYMYLTTNHGILPNELHYMHNRHFHFESKNEKTLNRWDAKVAREPIISTSGKLFESDRIWLNGDTKPTATVHRIYDDNEDYHFNNFIESFGMRDFNILFYT